MGIEISPMLALSHGDAAIEFYKAAFDASVLRRLGEGADIVAGLSLGGAKFFLAHEAPEYGTRGPASVGFTTVRIELFVDDPVLTEQGAQEGTECFLILERLERTGESELTHLKSSLQSGDELTAEDAAEHADGQGEGIPGMDPVGVIWRETSSWNQTVDMRMSQRILAPAQNRRTA
jgi:uncharacterized glyoxalase superfamily protein PhnB